VSASKSSPDSEGPEANEANEANEASAETQCGTIALVGRPNVGKSSLLNAFLGQKLAPTTHKPQTTQRQLRGVLTRDQTQFVFIDTPGLHPGKKGLHAFMVDQALDAARGVDVVVFMVEAERPRGDAPAGINEADERALADVAKARQPEVPVVLAINKIDQLDDKATLLPLLQKWAEQDLFTAIIPVSAHKKEGLTELLEELSTHLPRGAFLFDPDALTDASERDVVAELIREKAMLELRQELPYKIAVVVEEFDESRRDDPKKSLVSIMATLHVERESQKGMVVGKGGKRIKAIGERARKEVERLLGCKVMLKLFVRVEKDWTGDPKALRKLGYRRS
jgi:GTP-binding protein Era